MATLYQQFSLAEFVKQYSAEIAQPRYYELSLPWLLASESYMLAEGADVIVHCLFKKSDNKDIILIAWPLVHRGQAISSLTSFYSTVTEPLFFSKEAQQKLPSLLQCITQQNQWQSLSLGPIDSTSLLAQALSNGQDNIGYRRLFAQSDNFYLNELSSFEQYYQQRPSQLKNTIKRKAKKLAKQHSYHIDIITQESDLAAAFIHYKSIYQQSWKADEYSFDFIDYVCRHAAQQGKLRLGLLFVDNIAVAAQIWFVQESAQVKVASIFKLAYIPQYQDYSVGSLLSMALSEHVLSCDKVNEIEFGMGSEAYKKDWLPKLRSRVTYQFFNAQTIYGNLLALRKVLLPKVKAYFLR
ncbi:GNAT family N-acetyltransferase [Litorilituus sediminis]|uniref:GNAT family N-acetyltransferase n=1 Tax=Litorilituus sediminis TaxID=718192 RepID=A0A4P6PA97_9GAMM|nr:GNAT family N-acetyltransferase [Litorilituus sediminis]QBG36525.1 GNAT family N-acetyltransferase [Litorilituus sediminis]